MNERIEKILLRSLEYYEHDVEQSLEFFKPNAREFKEQDQVLLDIKESKDFVKRITDARRKFNESIMFD